MLPAGRPGGGCSIKMGSEMFAPCNPASISPIHLAQADLVFCVLNGAKCTYGSGLAAKICAHNIVMGRRRILKWQVTVMNKSGVDKRKFSGHRVLAECEVVLPITDPFARYDNVKKGYLVLNIRGGCLYLPEHFTEQNIDKIFPDGRTTVFKKLTLLPKDAPEIVIHNIKVTLVRLRKELNREGIVFRFTDITEQHLDVLDSLRYKLPIIGSNEEASVPFNEIIELDRGHTFEME